MEKKKSKSKICLEGTLFMDADENSTNYGILVDCRGNAVKSEGVPECLNIWIIWITVILWNVYKLEFGF